MSENNLNFGDMNLLGKVVRVDTGNVTIGITDENLLNSLQVNHLVVIRSTKTNEKIIALITKIIRKSLDNFDGDNENTSSLENIASASMIGTLLDNDGSEQNIFKRSLETIPSINTDCFLLDGNHLSFFMKSFSKVDENSGSAMHIGKYIVSDDADAYLDGNKFFQRHAVIVGSTGSGKSWTVSTILEKSSELCSVNQIVFDIHGEYQPLRDLSNTSSLKIAGPADTDDIDNLIFLPYWLFSYEEIETMLLDRSDNNAPNQARALFDTIIELKKEKLKNANKTDILNNLTIDSPVPYDIDNALAKLEVLDQEMVSGTTTREKQGPLHGKLTRFLQRLKSKKSDKRLNFMFNTSDKLQEYEWFNEFVYKLMNFDKKEGIKIIDFSEVPSDILPLVTSMIARIIFSVQQWMPEKEKRHPIALFCDEAHLYIPANTQNDITKERSLHSFDRIAKEGRKYSISLVVISQRPADVSKTVLSQCSNFVAMRLTNPNDQNVIKNLFPDNLGNFADLLPILDIGESLIIGDACLLPSRIRVQKPKIKPSSATVDFWDEWKKENKESYLDQAIERLRKQSK